MIVGEKRPELIVPDFSGTVIPRVPGSGAGRRGGAGATVINIHQTIDARGAVEGVPAQIQRALEANNRRLPNIIRDAQMRSK